MDNYGDAAREYIRARTVASSAAFFVEHLEPGMALLDCGCGEGTITVGLARLVTPGQVVGIDMAPGAIERSRHLAEEQALANVRFEVGSVYELPFSDGSFDAVFSHALFEHLTDTSKALSEIKRILKPGGVVGLRSPDGWATILHPPEPLIEQYWELFSRIRNQLGGDSHIGRRLGGLLRQSGYGNVTVSASLESYGPPEGTQWIADVHSRFALDSPYAKEWLERGWVDQVTLMRISAAWKAWAVGVDAFSAFAWCEAVGWSIPE